MRKAMEYTETMNRTLIDGITVTTPDASIVLLPDKERPAFIVAVEASTEESAQSIADEYKTLIMNWAENQ